MYTVLIQSKKTMDCLEQFYPLLSENIEADNIGRCLWIESGATVDTAMPELYDLISRKRAWKAVIVCSEFDDINTKYPADSVNPYDFLENQDREGLTIVNDEVIDCDAPLIRLTHMLGGIPSPEPKFKATIIEPENRVPWMEYHPVEDDETAAQKKAYDAWNEANMFKGLPPTEIILVKVRKASASRDMLSLVSSSWQVHTEADSSEFWKRNLYPHNCRFLVYDMDQRGIMKQQSDLFKFWIGILLISKNDIDPNVLQAHRLYSLNVILKESALAESFQQTINKLNMAKYQLEKSIAKDEEDISEVDAPIPDYSIGVPVSFQLPKVSDVHFDASQYGLTGGIGSEDMSSWNTYSKNAKKELQILIQSTDRTLDQAASRLREQCEYSKADVVPLTQYQEEDFNVSLAEVYKDMINNGERPKYYVENNHPAIIDSGTFGRVQEKMARRGGKRKVKQVGTKTEQGRYSSKYALTELLICGECGTPYRRCTWAANGKKKVVLRCINRLDYGKKYCHDSPSIEESVL